MNLLNEEIRVIQHTLSHMRRGVVLEFNQSRKLKMEKDINELESILLEKLNQCEEFRG